MLRQRLLGGRLPLCALPSQHVSVFCHSFDSQSFGNETELYAQVVACCTFAALSGLVLTCRNATRYKALAEASCAQGGGPTVVSSSVDVTNPLADTESFEEYRSAHIPIVALL